MSPSYSVLGVTKSDARKAIRWASKRGFNLWYRQKDQSLNAFEFRGGRDQTYQVMNDALNAAREA